MTVAETELRTDRFYGKYRATVFDNDDPLGQGRLRATVPAVLADVPSGWALPCTPYPGVGSGQYTIPAPGAGVWIEFEAGDPSYPIWTGGWWAQGDVPTDASGGTTAPSRKLLRSEAGLIVELDDQTHTLTLSDAGGSNVATIEVDSGTITVRGASLVVLEAPLIKHGAQARHPEVFGDDLLRYLNQLVTTFNAHTHPGETIAGMIPVTPAPPLPPFPPALPSLLSTKNVLE